MPAKYVTWKARVWKDVDADRWRWKCDKPKCRVGSASHWGIVYFFARRHTARHHIRSVNDLPEPCCFQQGTHYHCHKCGEITGMTGHWVGGPDGLIICDDNERQNYLREMAAAYRDMSATGRYH